MANYTFENERELLAELWKKILGVERQLDLMDDKLDGILDELREL